MYYSALFFYISSVFFFVSDCFLKNNAYICSCIYKYSMVMIENKSKILQPNGIKEIPYGVSDFTVMRDENLYYVDKSMYIPTLENMGGFICR